MLSEIKLLNQFDCSCSVCPPNNKRMYNSSKRRRGAMGRNPLASENVSTLEIEKNVMQQGHCHTENCLPVCRCICLHMLRM
jgi:hypothetical protein